MNQPGIHPSLSVDADSSITVYLCTGEHAGPNSSETSRSSSTEKTEDLHNPRMQSPQTEPSRLLKFFTRIAVFNLDLERIFLLEAIESYSPAVIGSLIRTLMLIDLGSQCGSYHKKLFMKMPRTRKIRWRRRLEQKFCQDFGNLGAKSPQKTTSIIRPLHFR